MNVESLEKVCACGRRITVEREIPEDLSPRWQEVLRNVGAECDECERRDQEREAAERDKEIVAARYRRVQESGLPPLLRGLTWDDLDEPPGASDDAVRMWRAAVDAAAKWSRREQRGLVLAGPVGVGKTRMAAVAANTLLDSAHLRWLSVPRLVQIARAGFGNAERREQAEHLISGSSALVMDDIDKANPTEWAKELLFLAIDERANAGAPLLVTTNLDYDELEERLGEPIASRLAGYCVGRRVEGADRRRSW